MEEEVIRTSGGGVGGYLGFTKGNPYIANDYERLSGIN
jgi:hypothetical protein